MADPAAFRWRLLSKKPGLGREFGLWTPVVLVEAETHTVRHGSR